MNISNDILIEAVKMRQIIYDILYFAHLNAEIY